MGEIYFTSDLHFNHDKEFLYKPRGFESIGDMNRAVVENWNEVVTKDDLVYVLGDLMLGGNAGTEDGIELLSQLNGEIHIILGNHDTNKRIEAYKTLPNVTSILYADRIKYNGYSFFLTHFPCITSNLEKETLKQCTINLFGHTHSKDKFYLEYPFMYNVALDAHDNRPVWIEKVLQDLKNKENECKLQL
jgi:calcineurin-like phosphoesterase family protein